jgi:hypothetical protein
VLAFVLMGSFCVVPVLHFILANGFKRAFEEVALENFIQLVMLNLTGAVVYASR